MLTAFSSADWWPGLRGRLLRAGALRGVRAGALLAGLACMAGLVQAMHPFPSPLLASEVPDSALQPYDLPAIAGAAPLHVVEPAYSLWAEPSSAVVTLASPSGRIYTTVPLCMLAGRTTLPTGTVAHTTLQNGVLHTRMLSRGGGVLSDAVLRTAAQSFTVSFSSPPGPDHRALPAFFSDGDRGMAMATIQDGYTPDVRGPATTALPVVSTVGRAPFAPPPFDLELRSAPGWFGIGLAQVPDATTMRLGAGGAVTVDYPLPRTASGLDVGAGAPVAGRVRFPDFVVTFAGDPVSGLRAYHDALAAQHLAPVASPPGSRPSWWSDPLVDTWGEQMATSAQRGSPHYGTAWVRNFVSDWKARYHLQHFTVVIDSRWQQRIGDPLPDVVRFGGIDGMRTLVDELHAQGLHVLLWWPMWAHGIDKIPISARQARLLSGAHVVDPTAPAFQSTMAATMETLLGNGPDSLGADGLKLDWQYDVPQALANPSAGFGALALFRYMQAIHTAAHALRPDAMIDASAVAPQFASVADTVRLYDAWSAAEWDRRAAIVAAVDPQVLIDGDGWQINAADALQHTVSSTVYGTPAMYFSRTWMGRQAIPAALSAELGQVMGLSALKGQGRAVPLAGGEWEYVVGNVVTARSFAGARALVVRSPSCTPIWQATVASGVGGRIMVPMSGQHVVAAFDGARRHVAATPVQHGVVLTLAPGGVYHLVFSGGC